VCVCVSVSGEVPYTNLKRQRSTIFTTLNPKINPKLNSFPYLVKFPTKISNVSALLT
jgi:hypothetical protein